jgi:murein DD-endopeptidase MepM/ murein hydrolase activator NlpD
MTDPRSTEGLSRTRRAALAAACALAALPATASAQTPSPDPAAATAAPAAPAAPAPTAAGKDASASARLVEARVTPRRGYYYGMKSQKIRLKVAAGGPVDLRVDIFRGKAGALERTFFLRGVQPNAPTTVPFDGLSGSGTTVRGKLRFTVKTLAGKPVPFAKRFAAKKGAAKQRFGFYDHIFPVRAKHSYGDGIGAGRGHQGQDVAAPCGSKLVAAQGGTVQVNAFQAEGAGYYLVIDTVGSDIDHVYMHLIAPPQLPVGTSVATGQVIGLVGSTGRSTGCHLHFEMWSGPGWYEGGAFIDPSVYLRSWDKYS